MPDTCHGMPFLLQGLMKLWVIQTLSPSSLHDTLMRQIIKRVNHDRRNSIMIVTNWINLNKLN